MPQGVVKPKASGGSSKGSSKVAHSPKARSKAGKPGAHAPKNAKVAKLQKDAKKGHGGLTSALEQRLAQRAGHTEMVGAKSGVRKDLGKKDMEKERKSGGAGAAHGSLKKA